MVKKEIIQAIYLQVVRFVIVMFLVFFIFRCLLDIGERNETIREYEKQIEQLTIDYKIKTQECIELKEKLEKVKTGDYYLPNQTGENNI